MLDRHVQIGTDLWVPVQDSDEFRGDFCRVGIEEADPHQLFQSGQFPEESGKGGAAGQVPPVGRCVLGDEDQFPNPPANQLTGLGYDVFGGAATGRTAEGGNNAVRTSIFATLGDF